MRREPRRESDPAAIPLGASIWDALAVSRVEHFHYHEEQGVATIRLDRPERLNALTFDVYAELRDTFATLRGREDVRCVVVTGTGRAFCTGGDVKDIIGKLFDVSDAQLLAFMRMTCDLVENILALEKPVIASLNGTTCGAGAVIAAACDLRIATTTAKIAFLFTKVGLCGADMGAAWLLPRIVGLGRATELLMTGDFVSAEQALAMGLYNRVVPEADLERETRVWSRKLADGPSMGLAMTKRMLHAEASMDPWSALQAEGWIQAECMKHPDYREAYDAFVEKRAPDFRRNRPESARG